MTNNHDQSNSAPDMDTGNPKKSKSSNSSNLFLNLKKRPVLTTIIICLIALVIIYLWKDLQGKRVRDTVMKAATEQIGARQQEMLLLLAKPLVWSIRAEMLRGNMEQVNILMIDIVKENNFQYLHLVEPDGIILLSTNKRIEGQAAGDEIDSELLSVEMPVVIKTGNNLMVIAAPVMGVDRRLATLIFGYQPEIFRP
ncbi:MAG: hypothetical protein ACNA7V_01290 [Bacteroidales bacterium]